MFADSQSDSEPNSTSSVPSHVNRAFLEGGVIQQKLCGDQTGETVDQLTHDTELIVEQLQAKQEPVLILSDYTEVGDADQASREKLRDVLGTRYFDRIAVFGVSPALRWSAN